MMKTAVIFNKKANEFQFLGTDGGWHPTSQFGWFAPETEKFGDKGLRAPLEYYFVNCSSWDEQAIGDVPLHIVNDLHFQLGCATCRLTEMEHWATRGASKSLVDNLVETGEFVRRLKSILDFRPKWTSSCTDNNGNLVFEEWSIDQDNEPILLASWRAE